MISRNGLLAIIGALVVVILVGGYWYQQQRQVHGIELNVGGAGVSIQTR